MKLNRVHEVISSALQGVREIEEWMSRSSGIPLKTLRQHLFLFRDRDATSHLLRLASNTLITPTQDVDITHLSALIA